MRYRMKEFRVEGDLIELAEKFELLCAKFTLIEEDYETHINLYELYRKLSEIE